LVVVAIIAILAALLLPSLRTARVVARRTACATHQRQVFLGLEMFRNDNNGRLPPGSLVPWPSGDPAPDEYKSPLSKLVPSYMNKLPACPNADPGGSGYGVNTWILRYFGGSVGDLPGTALSGGASAPGLDRIVLLGESYGGLIYAWSHLQYTFEGGNGFQTKPQAHGNRFNFTFMDGHVEALARGTSPLGWVDGAKTGGTFSDDGADGRPVFVSGPVPADGQQR
jgi:prepilin-type processing-associated H-X9-DG protein